MDSFIASIWDFTVTYISKITVFCVVNSVLYQCMTTSYGVAGKETLTLCFLPGVVSCGQRRTLVTVELLVTHAATF